MRPSRLPVTLSKRAGAAVQRGAYSVPLRVIEGVIHIRPKLGVKTFMESNILSKRDIPIVLAGAPQYARRRGALDVGGRWSNERAGVEIVRESALGVGGIRVTHHIQISEPVVRRKIVRLVPISVIDRQSIPGFKGSDGGKVPVAEGRPQVAGQTLRILGFVGGLETTSYGDESRFPRRTT